VRGHSTTVQVVRVGSTVLVPNSDTLNSSRSTKNAEDVLGCGQNRAARGDDGGTNPVTGYPPL
jgi:hypothetical protein